MKDSFSEKRKHGTDLAIDPDRTAVLVVDMLNDFFKPDGAMVLEGGEVLYEPIDRLIKSARAAGMPVFWLNQTLYPEDKLFQKRTVHCLEGTWGAEIVDDLSFGEADVIIAKRRYSGFFQTDLDLHLREREIRQLIVTGVVTNICVRSTVNDAYFLGYDVYVPSDCVMATSIEHQETHLYDIDTHYGTVLELDRVLAAIQPAGA